MDSSGYFRVSIPEWKEYYLRVEGGDFYEEVHNKLFVMNIEFNHSITIPFLPFQRKVTTLSEYVAKPAGSKFLIGKKKYNIVHEPPWSKELYPPGDYSYTLGDFTVLLEKREDGSSEVDFGQLLHEMGNVSWEDTRSDFIWQLDSASFQKYVDKVRNLPVKPITDSVVHQVDVRAIVLTDGAILYPKVIKSYDGWHDLEALRIIQRMPKLKPARSREPRRPKIWRVVFQVCFRYPE